jgi:hypothetical protein
MAKATIFNGNLRLFTTWFVIIIAAVAGYGAFGKQIGVNSDNINDLQEDKSDKDMCQIQYEHLREEIIDLKAGQAAIIKKLDEIKGPG